MAGDGRDTWTGSGQGWVRYLDRLMIEEPFSLRYRRCLSGIEMAKNHFDREP